MLFQFKAGLDALVQLRRDYSPTGLNERQNLLLRGTVFATSAWINANPPLCRLKISVIIATHNRKNMLPHAMDSVFLQTYRDLQLVVVDDGSSDGTNEVLEATHDQRLKVVRTEGIGLSAARNAGLARATGEVVCYLDDDNAMHPDWLRSVAWAFEHFPATEILYGARVCEDRDNLFRWGQIGESACGLGSLPFLDMRDVALEDFTKTNTMDANTIAHLREHREAFFDTTRESASDWDLAARFAQQTSPLALPVIACYYKTRDPERMSRSSAAQPDELALMRTLAGRAASNVSATAKLLTRIRRPFRYLRRVNLRGLTQANERFGRFRRPGDAASFTVNKPTSLRKPKVQ